MPDSLNKFLSIFDPKTIQRSFEYVQQINTDSISLTETPGRVVMSAKITGSHSYKTNIVYDIQRDSLVNTRDRKSVV